MTYESTIKYLTGRLASFSKLGKEAYKPGLERTVALSDAFGSPHSRLKVIHVGGTNGKGTVACSLAAVLQSAGYRVGLFTSPHLVDFRERIRVDGEMIPKEKVVDFVERFLSMKMDIEPSFFEFTTVMAFEYFDEMQVDVAVVEVGLGGRLDSTNIVTPELSIITNIGLEHQQFLGDTLEEIAREKAGIIKHGQPVVIGRAEGVVRDVFKAEAKRLYAEIKFAQDKPEVTGAAHVNGILRVMTKDYGLIDCELTGNYQVENVNTVLTAINILKRLKYRIKAEAIRQGFTNVVANTGLMGRWMKLGEKPLTICDSAHNPPGMAQVLAQLKREPHDRLHFVLGFMGDKDISTMLDMFPKSAGFYFTQAQTSRSMSALALREKAASIGIHGDAFNHVTEALEAARAAASKKDLIYVGGSMYVLAELLTALGYGDRP